MAFVPFVCVINLPPSIVFVFVPATSAEQACLDKNVTLYLSCNLFLEMAKTNISMCFDRPTRKLKLVEETRSIKNIAELYGVEKKMSAAFKKI